MLVCNVNDKLSSNSMKTITTLKKLMQMHKLERWHSVTLMIMHNTIMGASFLLKLIESTSRYINNPIAIFTLCVRNVLLCKCTIRLHVNWWWARKRARMHSHSQSARSNQMIRCKSTVPLVFLRCTYHLLKIEIAMQSDARFRLH